MSAEERRIQALEDELRTLKLQHGIGSSGSGCASGAGDGGSDQLSLANGRRRGGATNSPAVSGGGEYGCGGGAHSGIAEGVSGGGLLRLFYNTAGGRASETMVGSLHCCIWLFSYTSFISENFPGRHGVHAPLYVYMYTWWLNGVAALCLVYYGGPY